MDKKNAKKFSSLAIENAIKNNNEKKSRSQTFKFGSFSLHESITDDIRVSIWLVNLTHAETSYRI